jgi:hypothetical protein
MSAVESVANVTLGYFVAVGAQLLIFPAFGLAVDMKDNLLIGGAFTCVSLARSYALRRLFERFRHRGRPLA